ncbi:Iron-sulfur assembly protein 1 [Cytospora paraplurivora]|uniref:Iron-sulfur assembly protein 1 n=1 Tax=Cytospora paraplurivora TaxID=2898453 RepID=A0AAN9UHQ8_9PEZI
MIHPTDSPLPRVHETRPLKPVSGSSTLVLDQDAQRSQLEFEPSKKASSSPLPTSPPPPQQQQEEQQQPQQSASITEPSPRSPTASTSPKTRPRSKLRAPRKAAMKLTPSAVEHLRALLDQPDPKLIKVGVRNRGCSGLAYHLEYVDKPGAFDEAVEQDGVRVLIDSKALFSIIGSEMDWVEDKLNQRFVFRNPNISESIPSTYHPAAYEVVEADQHFFTEEQCGCGESFMV